MSDDKQQSGMKGIADRAEEMVGGVVGMASAATAGSVSAQSFVSNAVIGNFYELAAGGLAIQRGSELVKQLARDLIDDHTTADHQLQSTLRSIDGAPRPPTDMDDCRAEMIEHLKQAADDDFDDRYLEQQDLAHKETLALFRGYADSGDDPRLRLFATATVPSLERHHELVRAARKHH